MTRKHIPLTKEQFKHLKLVIGELEVRRKYWAKIERQQTKKAHNGPTTVTSA